MTDRDQHERVEHRAERTYTVPAAPEQVWEAIATAEGISSWFVPTRLEPRVGGEVVFDLGSATSIGVVTDYTPNERFAIEEPWPIADRPEDVAPDMAQWFNSIGVPLRDVFESLQQVSPIATEYLLEAASGGSTVIRIVTSAYGTGADWENEFFAQMAASLFPMFDNLITHFSETD